MIDDADRLQNQVDPTADRTPLSLGAKRIEEKLNDRCFQNRLSPRIVRFEIYE
ncbi:hypothetical protein [Rosistilla carotiformis]|uniref:hypothetical protein n=1 Tax=Rosistilla carotiformis TaxID=2528017 RepID=UPI0018D2716C|nr:hypothetical protein [Rosistilla carotiformis]